MKHCCLLALQTLVLLGFPVTKGLADGGVMRLRQVQGPFVITIFTTSELFPHHPVDVSVLVQRRDSNEVVLDATVDLLPIPPGRTADNPADPICAPSGTGALGQSVAGRSVPATRGQSSNKLLYAAVIDFDVPGDWALDATVKSQGDSAHLSCPIPVGPMPRQLIALVPYLVLPPLAALFFIVNQYLRRTQTASQYRRDFDTAVERTTRSSGPGVSRNLPTIATPL